MNKQDQEAYFNAFVEKMRATMLAKGDDYAGQDRLDNFKRAGAITGIGAPMQCLSLIATKVARLSSLIGGNKDPRNESVDDSILDLANYSVLLAMVIQDLSELKEDGTELKKDTSDFSRYNGMPCGLCGQPQICIGVGHYRCDNKFCRKSRS